MSEREEYDFINHMEGETLLTESKCGCGKGSCNKYQRCPTYAELLESYKKSDRYTWAYRKFTNAIDDYFEYSCESKKDQKKVYQLLQNLTETLMRVENED